jgi:hypothetical protein
MDQRISLRVVHLAAQASDIDANDIRRWIEVKIPDVLHQHPPRHDAVFVAHQIAIDSIQAPAPGTMPKAPET